MSDIFDDGLSAEELAMALALADEIAEDKRQVLQQEQDDEPLIPNDDAPLWFEKD